MTMKKIKASDIIALIICILIPLVVGSLSGIATSDNISTWYAYINKPVFNPPDYLFGPVWTVLYVLMGVSLFLVWKSPAGKIRKTALMIFLLQLGFNFAWTFIFFHFKMISLAFIEIIMLWAFIVLMIISFLRVDKTAAFLQIPYLLWVTFAAILNGAIFFLNR